MAAAAPRNPPPEIVRVHPGYRSSLFDHQLPGIFVISRRASPVVRALIKSAVHHVAVVDDTQCLHHGPLCGVMEQPRGAMCSAPSHDNECGSAGISDSRRTASAGSKLRPAAHPDLARILECPSQCNTWATSTRTPTTIYKISNCVCVSKRI